MSDFNPGPGWTLGVTGPDSAGGPGLEYVEHVMADGSYERWFREEPVPQLPTEAYTVIWAEWSRKEAEARQHSAYLILIAGIWYEPHFGRDWKPRHLLRHIDSFRVESEPRAVTANAVLDRIADYDKPGTVGVRFSVARDFGVDQ